MPKMASKGKIISHLSFWTIYESFSFYEWTLPFYSPGPGHLLLFTSTTLASLSTSLFLFYTNYSLFLPKLFNKKRYLIYILTIILSIAFFVISRAYIWHNYNFVDGLFSRPVQIINVFYICFFYYFTSTAFYFLELWADSEENKESLEKEIKETELLYLKSQMNPHFLFNTLNNIYGLALKNNHNTVVAIRQLKDLMLYNENFKITKKILLSEEVSYLNSYIQLYKLRISSPINFNYTIKSSSIYIEPMLLVPFIENAFKHGAHNEIVPIEIQLYENESGIQFKISNAINSDLRKDTVGGIGIANVKRRLELLYADKHVLTTNNDNNIFSVELYLNSND